MRGWGLGRMGRVKRLDQVLQSFHEGLSLLILAWPRPAGRLPVPLRCLSQKHTAYALDFLSSPIPIRKVRTFKMELVTSLPYMDLVQ